MALVTLTVMVSAVVWLVARSDFRSDRKTPEMMPVRVRVDEQHRRRIHRDR